MQIPRFAFEKFPGAKAELTTQMKSVGESMAIGRTFQVRWDLHQNRGIMETMMTLTLTMPVQQSHQCGACGHRVHLPNMLEQSFRLAGSLSRYNILDGQGCSTAWRQGHAEQH